MDLTKNLPAVKDFRIYGKFYNVTKNELINKIPDNILHHIYPNYLVKGTMITNNEMITIQKYCIILREEADYEDKLENLKNQKELQIRRLEDRIHLYYLNMLESCKCLNKK